MLPASYGGVDEVCAGHRHGDAPGVIDRRNLPKAPRYVKNAMPVLYFYFRMRCMSFTFHLRSLKTTMKMDVLRCETVVGVSKELLMFALVYNLVRLVMLEASHRQNVPVERISFVDALRWLTEARPGAALPKLVVNPDRADRVEPRVKKRRPKQYSLMKKPRSELRKSLLTPRVAA